VPLHSGEQPSTSPYEPPGAHPAYADVKRSRTRRTPRILIESLLIVLSVLLGFAANEWHERSSDRALADQALVSFRQEIAQNLATLEAVEPKHAAMADRLAAAANAVPGKVGETAFDAFHAAMPAGGVSVPPLSDAAWETATSTGALRFIGYERASRLSETYHMQSTTILGTGQRLEDRLSSPENFDPAQRRAMLRAESLLFTELSGVEEYLISVYRETLAKLGA
jgi:hypothetical protein